MTCLSCPRLTACATCNAAVDDIAKLYEKETASTEWVVTENEESVPFDLTDHRGLTGQNLL
jgi:hypothetical protein